MTAVANFNIKSGNNQYHGTGYDYILNTALDANSFDNNAFGISKNASPFRQNNFGGDFAGPVFFPKLYNGKNKTFFFFNYEGTRETSESVSQPENPSDGGFPTRQFFESSQSCFHGQSQFGYGNRKRCRRESGDVRNHL